MRMWHVLVMTSKPKKSVLFLIKFLDSLGCSEYLQKSHLIPTLFLGIALFLREHGFPRNVVNM